MKISTTLLVSVPFLVSQVAALAVPDVLEARQAKQGGKGVANAKAGGGKAANNGAAAKKGAAQNAAAANGGAGGAKNGAAAGGAKNGAAAGGANNGAAAGGAKNGAAGGAAAANGDPQKSTVLDPKVICKGFAQDGQAQPTAGQVASLTSTNNFINFCLTRPDLPLTDGKQIKTGSCNPAPIGLIPSTNNMPSSKFVFPKNMDNIGENTPFTIQMAISKLQTGNFVNAQTNYFSAPQQLNAQGQIKGHSHVVVEKVDSLTSTKPTDPNVFAFFKGLNAAAKNGVLTAAVDKGLPAGTYRLGSINTGANHAPAIVPIAQHGMLDDVVYFTVGAAAKAAAAKVAGAGAAAGGAQAGAGGAQAGAGGAQAGAGGAKAGAGGAKAGAGGAKAGAGGAQAGNGAAKAGNAQNNVAVNKGKGAQAAKGQGKGGAKKGQ